MYNQWYPLVAPLTTNNTNAKAFIRYIMSNNYMLYNITNQECLNMKVNELNKPEALEFKIRLHLEQSHDKQEDMSVYMKSSYTDIRLQIPDASCCHEPNKIIVISLKKV